MLRGTWPSVCNLGATSGGVLCADNCIVGLPLCSTFLVSNFSLGPAEMKNFFIPRDFSRRRCMAHSTARWGLGRGMDAGGGDCRRWSGGSRSWSGGKWRRGAAPCPLRLWARCIRVQSRSSPMHSAIQPWPGLTCGSLGSSPPVRTSREYHPHHPQVRASRALCVVCVSPCPWQLPEKNIRRSCK